MEARLAKLKKVYDKLAAFYRLFLSFPIFGLATEQLTCLPYIRGRKVLEVGCGTGLTLLQIARQGRQVLGLDLSPGMLAQAGRRLKSKGLSISLLQGSYYNLPFPKNSFDTVVATFTLTHAPNLYPVARGIRRVLNYGGRLIIVDVGLLPGHDWKSQIINRFWKLLGDHPRDEVPILKDTSFRIIERKKLSKQGAVHLLVAENISHNIPLQQNSIGLDRIGEMPILIW